MEVLAVALISALVLLVISLAVRRSANVECWHFYEASFGSVNLITHEEVHAPFELMRRRVDGRWQYRRMTEEEEADYASSRAW